MSTFIIDTDIPAGNIVVEQVTGTEVTLRPDLRDTEGHWFYWHFRVVGAAGQTLRFRLSSPNTLTVVGPAVSLDGGWTWAWLGADACDDWSFEYAFPNTADDVRFSMGMPYTGRQLDRFIERLPPDRRPTVHELCTTRKGRRAEYLLLGPQDRNPSFRVLLTARHHCCEMMASYTLEGMLETMLGDDTIGAWYRDHVAVLAVPFVDKDGVEDGDQGKNRRPRDHNRDYSGDSVHRETAAIRALVPAWAAGRLDADLDLHCPWIRNEGKESIYLVGQADERIWREQCRFGDVLEGCCTGPLPYCVGDNLPFGTKWNTAKNRNEGLHAIGWGMTQPGIRLASDIEIPYAVVGSLLVTQSSARALGHDLARALQQYLIEG